MSLPNADRAIIDPAKVRDYLLSGSHPVGRFKATLFVALGYTADRWEILRDDLLTLARTCVATPGQSSLFGLKFELDGILIWAIRAICCAQDRVDCQTAGGVAAFHHCISEVNYV